MPHGTGHHGGVGHHGGAGHQGGVGHHGAGHHGAGHNGGAGMQHNHHHHHNFAPPYYQNYDNVYRQGQLSGERAGYNYGLRRGSLLQRRPKTVILTLVLMASIIAAVIVLVNYRSAFRTSSNIHGNTYLSRDTALISYTHEFCDKLTIEGSGDAAEPTEIATLYLLQSQPSQTQRVLSLNESFSINQNYKYWMFPLLANSRITINACFSNYLSAPEFDLLRGEGNFSIYKEFKYSADFIKSINIPSCDAGNEVLTNYQINYDDKYYLIFDSAYLSSNLQVAINIKQQLYTVSADTVVSNCSIALKQSRNSCSLSVPFSSIYSKALVQLEPNSKEINWETMHVVTVRCRARAWLIAVICVAGALVVALLFAGIAGYFVYRRLRQTSDSNTRRINDSTAGAEVDAIIDGVETSARAPFVESPEETAPLIGSAKPDEDPPPPYNYKYYTLPSNNS